MPLLRRARAVAIGTALLATGCFAVTPLAHADPGPAPTAGCAQGGPTLRYLVVFPPGTTGSDADAEITAACGTTFVYYPQIAVAVATSADPSFTARIGPDRAYSAQAEAYRDTDQQPGSNHKGDELPADLPDAAGTVSGVNRTSAQWDMSMIKADQAHRITEGSGKILVGVLDSGISPNHPNLSAELDPGASAGCVSGKPDTSVAAWAPTTSAHGTHVAGTIAAADDGHGIVGVAPGVRVASVKVVDDNGYIYPEAAVCGFMWAATQGMNITNNSYFVDPWVFTCQNTPGQHVVYTAVRRAVSYATAHGVLNIAAAGNGGVDLTNPGQDSRSPDNSDDQRQRTLGEDCAQLPAGLPGVVTVSAVGANQVKAGYSSYGLGAIDLTAPGGDPRQRAANGMNCVLSTVPSGYASSCGTSMAAPHVAGVAALLASTHPGASPKQLTQLLNDQADPIACPADYDLNGTGSQDAYCTGDGSYNSFYGHGMVDALAAVSSGTITSPPPTASSADSTTPAPVSSAIGGLTTPATADQQDDSTTTTTGNGVPTGHPTVKTTTPTLTNPPVIDLTVSPIPTSLAPVNPPPTALPSPGQSIAPLAPLLGNW